MELKSVSKYVVLVTIILVFILYIMFDFSDKVVLKLFSFYWIISAFFSFFIFDKLIKYEFEKYPSQWQVDGEPGFLKKPKEMRQNWYIDPQRQLMQRWLFKTPYWITKDKHANFLLCIYRILVVNFFLGAIIGLFV